MKLSVNNEKLHHTGSLLTSQLNTLEKISNQILHDIHTLDQTWIGVDHDAFLVRAEEDRKKAEQLENKLGEYIMFLMEVDKISKALKEEVIKVSHQL